MRLLTTLLVLTISLPALAQEAILEGLPTPSGRVDVACEVAELRLTDDRGRAMADMTGFAYLAQSGVDVGDDRPITFFWNGGPGAAAALLHTGFGAPLSADSGVEGDGQFGVNPYTFIDLTDLVYVDPVGTGFSSAAGRYEDADFWGVVPDADAAAEFVETFLEEWGIENRPVYLCGESYGAVRVAAMLAPLEERGIEVEGLILISPALESATITRSRARGAGRADRLPTFAALAAHRGLREVEDEAEFVDQAYLFSREVYLPALQGQDRLDEATLDLVRETRDLYTARASGSGYDQHDARFRASEGALGGIETSTLGNAVKTLLSGLFGVETDGRYRLMNGRANGSWRSADGRTRLFEGGFGVPPLIAEAATVGRRPSVFIAGGWYDLVTPFATNRRLAESGAFGRADVTVRDFPAGHVIYADPRSHEGLVSDLRLWLNSR
ncbi:MAG: hypothetical protein AAGB51_01885 [Planctomycetota bacterium]